MGYLDNTGLSYLWSKFKALLSNKVDTTNVETTVTNDSKLPTGSAIVNYAMPVNRVATSTQIGGVKPTTKTDIMSQLVGVDSDGLLWTQGISDATIFSGVVTVSGFTETTIDSTTAYTETISISDITSGTFLSPPMYKPSGNKTNDALYQDTIAKISDGYCDTGDGTITIVCWDKPTTDTTVYWIDLTATLGQATGKVYTVTVPNSSSTSWTSTTYNGNSCYKISLAASGATSNVKLSVPSYIYTGTTDTDTALYQAYQCIWLANTITDAIEIYCVTKPSSDITLRFAEENGASNMVSNSYIYNGTQWTQYSATFLSTGWTSETVTNSDSTTSTAYKQTIAVTGVTDKTFLTNVEYKPSGVLNTDDAFKTAFSVMWYPESSAGTITMHATQQPSSDIVLYFLGKETA